MKAQIEQIPAASRQSFVCRRFEEVHFDHPFHYHPEIEFTYIERSSGTLIVGDHVGPFGPGDLCILGENLPHVFRNTLKPTDRAISEVLHLPRDCSQGFIDAVPELHRFSALMDQASLGLKFDSSAIPDAGQQLAQIRQATGIRRWTLFMTFIAQLIEAPHAGPLASTGYTGRVNLDSSDRMRRTCQYILEHFDEALSHAELARRVHLSPAYFSRVFHQTTRRTFTQFLTEVRLGHACRLLLESDLPILEIALRSGFQNLSNFNRRFKTAYGRSPRAYRQRGAEALV
jgi:AraC-like DNA-binding protein